MPGPFGENLGARPLKIPLDTVLQSTVFWASLRFD
jgi:hypothetical protein